MTNEFTPMTAISPLAAQLNYLADMEKEEATYNDAWRAWCPSYEISSKRMLLQTTFSYEDVPALDTSSGYSTPVSPELATPVEHVQTYFEQVRKNREGYNLAWSTAVEKRILCARNIRESRINIKQPPKQLDAQFTALTDLQLEEEAYYETWSSSSLGSILSVYETHEPVIKIASSLDSSNTVAIQLQLSAERREREEAYDEAWISAAKDGSLLTSNSRSSATTIPYLNVVPSTLASQLQAAADEDAAEQAYADAWSRYTEIIQHARAIDAWKAHNVEIARNEIEYYNAWSETTKQSAPSFEAPQTPVIRISSTYETDPFASQLAVFQDDHARFEQYNEAWISYGNRHVHMVPSPMRNVSRRSSAIHRLRPAFAKRQPIDHVSPEPPMLGFSAIELVSENAQYVASWVDKMKATTITPANSLLLSPPSRKRGASSSPNPKKRADKSNFMWPEDVSEQERIGMTARGNLQPYLSSLLGKIVSFELVSQSDPSVLPDLASPETPMQITRRAHLKCQHQVVCKVRANISIANPEMATRYARDPLPVFDTLRSIGHAAVIQLDQVGASPMDVETGRQAIWRKYSVVSGAFRCEVKETFVDRKIFSSEGCDFGKKVVIKDGIIMSPNGVDYRMLSV